MGAVLRAYAWFYAYWLGIDQNNHMAFLGRNLGWVYCKYDAIIFRSMDIEGGRRAEDWYNWYQEKDTGMLYIFCFQSIINVQGLLLVGLKGQYRVPGIEPALAVCKASKLPVGADLSSPWYPGIFFIKLIHQFFLNLEHKMLSYK